jgi:hypothetical protein
MRTLAGVSLASCSPVRRSSALALLLLVIGLGLGLGGCSGGDDDDDDSVAVDGGSGTLPFMSECTLGESEECETGLCFDFNAKGPHCTHACKIDDDCEAPSPGCSGMGVCKAPDLDGGSGGDGGGGGGS